MFRNDSRRFTQFVFTEFSPPVEGWFNRSWSRIMLVGLGLALAGLIVLMLPRLIAVLIALALFSGAALFIAVALNLRRMAAAVVDQ